MKLPRVSEIKEYFQDIKEDTIINFLIVSEAIFSSRTTNLNKAKDELSNILVNQSTTRPDSNYKRLTRFFVFSSDNPKMLTGIQRLILVIITDLLPKKRKDKLLALDGTSWELGDKKIHLLTLSLIINGISIPIVWKDLNKKGTSNFTERKKVIDEALSFLNLEGYTLLADREYIGVQWFSYLRSKNIHFVIRLKQTGYKSYVDDQRGEKTSKYLHQHLRHIGLQRAANQKYYRNTGVSKRIIIDGYPYSFVVYKNPKPKADEPLLYFLSSLEKKKKIVKLYPIRWSIETCFKHLKSNGFNLEEINLKASKKVETMMAILVFLYALCIREGLLNQTYKKSDFKKYSGKIFRSQSIFRSGRSIMAGKFYHFVSFIRYLRQIIKQIGQLKLSHVQ